MVATACRYLLPAGRLLAAAPSLQDVPLHWQCLDISVSVHCQAYTAQGELHRVIQESSMRMLSACAHAHRLQHMVRGGANLNHRRPSGPCL